MTSKPKVTIDDIDQVLPQTQCGECGYAGCRPYAEAIINHGETINRCPPGGVTTLKHLATLLEQDPAAYIPAMAANTRPPMLAYIQEELCIGCTKCIQACPVDAIIGAAKYLHTVLSQECTGCQLCVEPCPVDCIEMQPISQAHYDKAKAKQRYFARQQRLIQRKHTKLRAHQAAKQAQLTDQQAKIAARKRYIQAALTRVHTKKQASKQLSITVDGDKHDT
ncbi:MAG: RnfABCDGE type electron transport complex subunit B [Gammaproteobacteria bacterium]